MINRIKNILKNKENSKYEFKLAEKGIPLSLYETICAFANTNGGEILLGVNDNGEIVGISDNKINVLKKNFVDCINNPQKNNPPLYLQIEECKINNKKILYINVPVSSSVQRCNNKIYIRNFEGDMDITHQQNEVARLYTRKQNTYYENQIIPELELADLRPDLISRARKRASIQKENHFWQEMNDFDLLNSASLYKKDFTTGQKGYTIACALLFGKDETIHSILPHYKTDLLLKIQNKDRYDDRDDVRTNLIDSFDRIMNFIQKHLPEKFYLNSSSSRINLRNIIFREVAVNLLIHREYSDHFPAKLVIEENKIYSENANKPYIHGNITLQNTSPFPKNPTIAKFFKEIGLAEELGSGIRNIYKYAQNYANYLPILIDGDVFKFELEHNLFLIKESAIKPNNPDKIKLLLDQARDQARDQAENILEFCKKPKSLKELMKKYNYKSRNKFKNYVLKPLLEKNLVTYTIPEKLTSPNQKYISIK